jgi:molybdopterin converting factor small subunit
MPTLAIKLFGPDARTVGRNEIILEFPQLPISCGELRKRLAQLEPKLIKSLANSRFAVNCEFVGDEVIVNQNDEVAIIGNVSGG